MVSKSFSDPGRQGRRYYSLHPSYATRYYWGQVNGLLSPEGLVDLGLRRLDELRAPMVMDVDTGTVAADFIWNGYLYPVVSKKVVEILGSKRLTGWSTYHVKVVLAGKEIAGYHGLAITGRGGLNDPKAYASGVIKGTRILNTRGLLPTDWDGSDLFTLDDAPRIALTTERVRAAFREAKVMNCKFEPSEDFEFGL